MSNEEIEFVPIECGSISVGQHDAVTRIHAANKVLVAFAPADDFIARIHPVNCQALINSPFDLSRFHRVDLQGGLSLL